MHLYIGNKLYSSWSLRPWLAMRALDIPFDETLIPFTDTQFKQRVEAISPAGLVPVLVDGEAVVWETIAIMEYLHDRFPAKGVWPVDPIARAHARSISAEMHAGFGALRAACPMNLGKRFATRNRGEGVSRDVERVTAIIDQARSRFGAAAAGPFLYGAFTAADAMYAPLLTRLDTYSINVNPKTRAYIDAVLTHKAFSEWLNDALQEEWVFAEDEIDEPASENLRPHLN